MIFAGGVIIIKGSNTEDDTNKNVGVYKFCVFYGCDALSSSVVPQGVTSIEVGAFVYCENLDSITIVN